MAEGINVDDETWTHISVEQQEILSSQAHADIRTGNQISRENYLPLTNEECMALFDIDGRLVKEASLRKALFEG